MKKYLSLVILIILFSCKKDDPLPLSCFTLSKTSADVNETITATNCSTNASSYLWTDSDGGISTNQNTSFIVSARVTTPF